MTANTNLIASDGVSNVNKRRAKIQNRMADFGTPLIKNCWYVAAWGDDIKQELFRRQLLGIGVVMYRTGAGRVVAMHDRCPHRSMPLSMGWLEGDSLRCGYHGLLFSSEGNCVDVPGQGTPTPPICVTTYKVIERGPLIWIWLGDQELADAGLIPEYGWLQSPEWTWVKGQMHMEANYVGLHENLLDLSHFTFLHPGNIGTPEYASTPFETEQLEDKVHIRRFVPTCDLPDIYVSTGLKGKKISRKTHSLFSGPNLHRAYVELTDLNPDSGSRAKFSLYVTHFITPESQGATHYYFAISRDFAHDDETASRTLSAGAIKAFNEDKGALEAIAEVTSSEPPYEEINIKVDQGGIAMRRIIKRLADAETTQGMTEE